MQRALTEKEAENLLEREGFQVAKRISIEFSDQLKTVEQKIKFPWVMKASSSKIMHKAKLGGVILNINNISEAKNAFEKLATIEKFEEAVVQETIQGEELIVGLKKTPEFGVVLMFGHGGTHVEEEKDVSFRMFPLNKKDIREMIAETKISKILREKNIKIDKLEKVLQQTAELVKKYPNIIEFDINPLFLNKDSAIIADARMVLEEL